ncbi:hypothetical protein [Haliscomenobacter sp.]|jgi:hypothetical protein|uniref:hypothetical protein n=1 Tax=Haliscomenobacter sp. TaxID=2717303 RepID=UPI003364BD0E
MSETTEKKSPFWKRIRPKKDAATSKELWGTLDTAKEKIKKIQENKKNNSSNLDQTFDAIPE